MFKSKLYVHPSPQFTYSWLIVAHLFTWFTTRQHSHYVYTIGDLWLYLTLYLPGFTFLSYTVNTLKLDSSHHICNVRRAFFQYVYCVNSTMHFTFLMFTTYNFVETGSWRFYSFMWLFFSHTYGPFCNYYIVSIFLPITFLVLQSFFMTNGIYASAVCLGFTYML